MSHGIGLNICKKLAIGLGGDLTLSPEVKDGSQFNMQFTLNRSFPKKASEKVLRKKFQKVTAYKAIQRRGMFLSTRLALPDIDEIASNENSDWDSPVSALRSYNKPLGEIDALDNIMEEELDDTCKKEGCIIVADDQMINI